MKIDIIKFFASGNQNGNPIRKYFSKEIKAGKITDYKRGLCNIRILTITAMIDLNKVPKTSLTVGIATITDAKQVVIVMTGPAKARALQQAVEGSVSQMWPVTALQLHENAIIVADDNATDELKVGTVKYFKGIEN